MAAALAELLDDALELDGAEAVAGFGSPPFDLRHQDRARVAQRPQRRLQARRPRRRSLRAVAARRRGGAQEEEGSGVVGSGVAGEEPAAADAEQAARGGEEGR